MTNNKMPKFIKYPLLFLALIYANIISATTITLDGKVMPSLSDALEYATDGSRIELGAGIISGAGVLTANNVTIAGKLGTHIKDKSTKGKAALVIKGNNTEISSIECSNINVPDGNGACIRLEGKGLMLDNVYFHSSQQGILTGKNPGKIFITDSRFEQLGHKGQAHGIYIGGGELYISNSHFLSSKSEGHEIKSRAHKNIILDSVIASQNGHDSRLVDIPNGGVLEIQNTVMQQGDNTSNWNLIGYGLEGMKYEQNQITISNNIMILDRINGSLILHSKSPVKTNMFSNIIIGHYKDEALDESNILVENRKKAGIAPIPFLPTL